MLTALKDKRYYPLYWIILSVLVVVIDFGTGPEVQFPIASVIPVILASWYSGPAWGMTLAILLSIARLPAWFVWDPSVSFSIKLTNTAIKIVVLGGMALMVNHAARLTREVKLLKGLLPICSACKRIRTEKGEWTQLEGYIAEHSEAEFTHGLCEECAKKLYSEYLKKK